MKPPRGTRAREHSSHLLRRARAGSTTAADEVLQEVGGKLLALIRLRLGPDLRARLESRDILQMTMLRAFEHFDQFEGSGHETLMGWLAAIARRELMHEAEFQHRLKRDREREMAYEEGNEVPLDPIGRHVRSEVSRIHFERKAQLVERALEQLAVDHREVVLLRRYEELSFPEIAERMERSPEACRKLFNRAMTTLTMKVYELGGELEP